jgi:hypothetical protein
MHEVGACTALLWAQDFAEAIAQLAMYPAGRNALLENPNVAEALQRVAAEGWTEEARLHAESALVALKPPDKNSERAEGADKHVMVSYQWDHQATVRRIVTDLQTRGYRTWFGAPSSSVLALDLPAH